MTFNDLLSIADSKMCTVSVGGSISGITNKMRYSVNFIWCGSHGDIKSDGLLISAAGFGDTLDEAAVDYCQKIRGKTIVFHAHDSLRNEITI